MPTVAVFESVSEDGLAYTAVRGEGVADAVRRWSDNLVASYGDEVIFREEWPNAPHQDEDWVVVEWNEPPRTILVVEREEDANADMLAFLIIDNDFEPIKVVAPPNGEWTQRWWENTEQTLDGFLASDDSLRGDAFSHYVVFATCKAIGGVMRLRYREGYADANGTVYGGVYFLARDSHGYHLV